MEEERVPGSENTMSKTMVLEKSTARVQGVEGATRGWSRASYGAGSQRPCMPYTF